MMTPEQNEIVFFLEYWFERYLDVVCEPSFNRIHAAAIKARFEHWRLKFKATLP